MFCSPFKPTVPSQGSEAIRIPQSCTCILHTEHHRRTEESRAGTAETEIEIEESDDGLWLSYRRWALKGGCHCERRHNPEARAISLRRACFSMRNAQSGVSPVVDVTNQSITATLHHRDHMSPEVHHLFVRHPSGPTHPKGRDQYLHPRSETEPKVAGKD